MEDNLKCYKCRWCCFAESGYSEYTVTDEWVSCPSDRFAEVSKYDDSENKGLIELASKDCPYFLKGEPAQNCMSDEYEEDEVADRVKEFEETYKTEKE